MSLTSFSKSKRQSQNNSLYIRTYCALTNMQCAGWFGRGSLVAAKRTSIPGPLINLIDLFGLTNIPWFIHTIESNAPHLQSTQHTLTDNLELPFANPKCYTCSGYNIIEAASNPAIICTDHTTLMRPYKGKAAACGSSILILFADNREDIIEITLQPAWYGLILNWPCQVGIFQ